MRKERRNGSLGTVATVLRLRHEASIESVGTETREDNAKRKQDTRFTGKRQLLEETSMLPQTREEGPLVPCDEYVKLDTGMLVAYLYPS